MATYKTRAQFVADDLRGRILGGEFKGGTQLRQDALARDYDVSRIPVREALLTLESEGLVALPEEVTAIEPGNMVDFLPFSEVCA